MVSPLRRVSCVAALGLAMWTHDSTAALAQGSPTFGVASVRPSPDGPPAQGQAGVHITKNQVRFAYLSLRDYLSIAFSVPIHQVSGPEWISSARFVRRMVTPPCAPCAAPWPQASPPRPTCAALWPSSRPAP